MRQVQRRQGQAQWSPWPAVAVGTGDHHLSKARTKGSGLELKSNPLGQDAERAGGGSTRVNKRVKPGCLCPVVLEKPLETCPGCLQY